MVLLFQCIGQIYTGKEEHPDVAYIWDNPRGFLVSFYFSSKRNCILGLFGNKSKNELYRNKGLVYNFDYDRSP